MRSIRALIIAVGLSLTAFAANAQQYYDARFTLKFGAASGYVQSVFHGAAHWWYAGAFRMSWLGPAIPEGYPDPLDVFCIDLAHVNNMTSEYAVSVNPLPIAGAVPFTGYSVTQTKKIAALYNQYAGGVANNAVGSAALQVALWDVLEGNGDQDVRTGNDFRVVTASSATIITQANSYLSWLNANPSLWDTRGTIFAAREHPNGRNQDMLGPAGHTPAPPAPVVFLIGTGVWTLSFYRKRRR